MNHTIAQHRLLTINETISTLRIGRSLLYKLLDNGEIESIKVGARRLIPADALDAYIASLRSGGDAA